MASGSSYTSSKLVPREHKSPIRARVTRQLQTRATEQAVSSRVVDAIAPDPLARHRSWLNLYIICAVPVIIFLLVLLSAGINQRPGNPKVLGPFEGQGYAIQVGGTLAASWQTNEPLPPRGPLPTNAGPYSVLGKPTISVDFINQVLASYNSPTSGKGQVLYDLGVKYGIDPAFALAFFMHESTFGTVGEARRSLSLGNLRCIPNFACQDGFAWFPSWESGFEAWYKLIRNLYVAIWGLTTVDEILVRYSPSADHNNPVGYIVDVKHTVDAWRTGVLR